MPVPTTANRPDRDLASPIVKHAAQSLMARIDAMNGHCARHLLKVIVEDLTTYPDELGNAVAVLRLIARNLPSEPPQATEAKQMRYAEVLQSASLEQIATEIDRRGVRTRASHCSCGRAAREVLDGGEHGPTGYCGGPNLPLDECDCGQGTGRHDRSVCHIYGRGTDATG